MEKRLGVGSAAHATLQPLRCGQRGSSGARGRNRRKEVKRRNGWMDGWMREREGVWDRGRVAVSQGEEEGSEGGREGLGGREGRERKVDKRTSR